MGGESTKRSIVDSIPDAKAFEPIRVKGVSAGFNRMKGNVEVRCPVVPTHLETVHFEIEFICGQSENTIEQLSFSRWLDSFSDKPLGLEGAGKELFYNIVEVIEPSWMRVKVIAKDCRFDHEFILATSGNRNEI